MRFALSLGLVLGLAVAAPALAANGDQLPLNKPPQGWSFEGPFGMYNRADLQHGFQVYKEVCSACHSLNRVAFHTLSQSGGPEFSDAQMKAIAGSYKVLAGPNDKGETTDDKGNPLTRPGTPADASVATHLDHRIAMSMAVAGLASAQGVGIDDTRPIATSFPVFEQLIATATATAA